MNDLSPHKRAAPRQQTRISPKVREAIGYIIREGLKEKDAAERAGITYGNIWKAKQRQAVKDYIAEQKLAYIQEVEEMKAPYKAAAFDVAKDLMFNAKSEAVRARMVEFLAGGGKGNAVNVQINNSITGAKGYEYAHPDQQIVEIRGPADSASPAIDAE